MLDALLIHNAVEKFQLLTFIVETLRFIPIVDFDHEFLICLHLKYLVEANTLSLRLPQRSTQYVRSRPLMLVAVRHVFRCCIEKGFALKDGPLLNNCTYVIVIDFALWELQSTDAALAYHFFGVREELVRFLLI